MSPRDAAGTTGYLTADSMRQREDVLSGGSYLSSNDFRSRFGLGDRTYAGAAEIHWPGGTMELFKAACAALTADCDWPALRYCV